MTKLYRHLSDTEIDEMLKIYNDSFINIKTDKENFIERLRINKESNTYLIFDKGKIIGFSVFYKKTILLLCVKKEYRNQGTGTELLRETEKQILSESKKIILGDGGFYIVPGVPMDEESDFHEWFQKRGYRHTWTGFDMAVNLEKFRPFEIYHHIDGITFRKRNENDPDEIRKSAEFAKAVELGWGLNQPGLNVNLALDGDQIVGVVMVDAAHGCIYPISTPDAGIFAYIAVLKEYQNRRIGRKLCQDALIELKNCGCKTCYIGYTYLDKWYGKFGAEIVINYWMGEKTLV